MDRKDFLKAAGITTLAATVPFLSSAQAKGNRRQLKGAECTIVPAEIAGPFPLDLTDNAFYFRQDVREDREGTLTHLRMRIIGSENCEPMPNVRVNIWHCDSVGNYSGYGTQLGTTYLRGYQMTDANGEVEFITAFPGWYPGRVCHIHFQVFVSSSYAAVSQYTFPHDVVNEVYAGNEAIYTDGADPLTPETDGAFVDGYDLQLSTLEPSDADEYDAFLEVTVEGSGTTVGVGHIERQTAAQMELGQNYPNPFTDKTTVPITLHQPAQVELELWSPAGQKVKHINLGQLSSGSHPIDIDFNALGIPAGSYLYQCSIENSNGRFTTVKRMTAAQ